MTISLDICQTTSTFAIPIVPTLVHLSTCLRLGSGAVNKPIYLQWLLQPIGLALSTNAACFGLMIVDPHPCEIVQLVILIHTGEL